MRWFFLPLLVLMAMQCQAAIQLRGMFQMGEARAVVLYETDTKASGIFAEGAVFCGKKLAQIDIARDCCVLTSGAETMTLHLLDAHVRPESEAREIFGREFCRLLVNKNTEELLNLHCWEGLPPQMRGLMRDYFQGMEKKVTGYKILPLEESGHPLIKDLVAILKKGGLKTNVPLTHVLVVETETGTLAPMPIGLREGRWLIGSAIGF